jgi:hypothetical protein
LGFEPGRIAEFRVGGDTECGLVCGRITDSRCRFAGGDASPLFTDIASVTTRLVFTHISRVVEEKPELGFSEKGNKQLHNQLDKTKHKLFASFIIHAHTAQQSGSFGISRRHHVLISNIQIFCTVRGHKNFRKTLALERSVRLLSSFENWLSLLVIRMFR